MKLKDITDMEEYLEHRCYCPYEIYDMTGFFFQYFHPDTECKLIAEGERGAVHGTFVLAKADEDSKEQIIYIEHTDGRVDSCVRFDATKNNKHMVLDFLDGRIERMTIDKYADNTSDEDLKEILSMADAIMLS